MSGIYGIYGAICDENSAHKMSVLKQWNEAYGNDADMKLIAGTAGLGICADHITGAPGNATPVLCKNSYVAVIDAILYNRDELAATGGFSEKLSDEELLFEYMLKKGPDALEYVNGDFCGAFFNTDTQELILFRDHMGIRPLFVYRSEQMLAFSSDIRGLAALPDVSALPNPDWVYRHVCGYDTADYAATELKDIYGVKPASYVSVRNVNAKLVYEEHIYWELGRKKIRFKTEKEYADRLRELITASVKRRLDVFPDIIGAELSGGLDSGVIDILINRLGREAVFYSWSFSPKDLPYVPDDERLVIADICAQENIICEYGETTMNMGESSNLGKSHAKLGFRVNPKLGPEFNYALPPYINTLIVCETAQFVNEAGGKVVFTGHGGDEGVSHRCDPYEMFYHKEYIPFLKYFWDRRANAKLRLLRALKDAIYKVRKGIRYQKRPFMVNFQAPDLLKKEFFEQYKDKKMPVLTFAYDVITYIYSGNTHNRPDVTALLGAHAGARYVFPYLDYTVIDYAVSIPRHLFLKGNQNRYIFRQAFKEIMPDSLYKCTAKNNPSEENLERDNTNWFEKYKPYREFLMKKLDRDYWAPFLDYDVLDKWNAVEKLSAEEEDQFRSIAVKLNTCVQLQNMVEMAKGTGKTE